MPASPEYQGCAQPRRRRGGPPPIDSLRAGQSLASQPGGLPGERPRPPSRSRARPATAPGARGGKCLLKPSPALGRWFESGPTAPTPGGPSGPKGGPPAAPREKTTEGPPPLPGRAGDQPQAQKGPRPWIRWTPGLNSGCGEQQQETVRPAVPAIIGRQREGETQKGLGQGNMARKNAPPSASKSWRVVRPGSEAPQIKPLWVPPS